MARSYRRILGGNIRRRRKRAGWTQEKLAEKADLTYKYLGEVERGLVNVSLDSLIRLARALGVRLRDLIRGI